MIHQLYVTNVPCCSSITDRHLALYFLQDALLEGFRHICYKEIHPVLSRIFHKIPQSELM